MKNDPIIVGILIIVIVLGSIGYNYYKRVYGSKPVSTLNTTQVPNQPIDGSQITVNSMYYASPVMMSVEHHTQDINLQTMNGNANQTFETGQYTPDLHHQADSYSESLPQYAEEDGSKLPPYRDGMNH